MHLCFSPLTLLCFCSHSLGTFEETATKWWYSNSSPYNPSDEELALHQELISRWASFAKEGNPNNGTSDSIVAVINVFNNVS